MIDYFRKEKLFIILIIISLILSFIKISSDVSNYDKYFTYDDGTKYHAIIRSPPEQRLWQDAAKIKKELKNNNFKVLLQPYEFTHHFLPEKILGIFGMIFNMEFYEDEKNEIYTSDNKKNFFIFQTLIYIFSIIFFYKKLKKININELTRLVCVGFLLFEPTINQFNTTIFGETIFFSLIILIFSFLIDLSKKDLFYLFYGFLIGICYLQRSVAMFLISVPLVFIFFRFKKKSITKIINLLVGFSIILLTVGYLNYNRSNIFYILPTITLHNLTTYLSPKILMKKGLTRSEAISSIIEEKEKIIKDKNLDINKEVDKIELAKIRKQKAVTLILENKLITFIEITKSTVHSMLLNPIEVKNVRIKGMYYYKSDLHKSWIKYRITYTILVFLIILCGFFYSVKKRILAPSLFCLIGLSIFSISSWVGYTRYFVPFYLCLSLYFSFGIYFLFITIKKKLKYL